MRTVVLALSAILFWQSTAFAVTPEERCQSAKNQEAGKYASCRQRAEKNFVINGDTARYSRSIMKCDNRLSSRWASLEQSAVAAGTSCPTTMDASDMQSYITANSGTIAASLALGGSLPFCGDGVINVAGEQCDGADLGGASCSTLGFAGGSLLCVSCVFNSSGCGGAFLPSQSLQSEQTTCTDNSGSPIACAGSGQDGETQYGIVRSYSDPGTGIVIDNRTGLMWEKLSDDGSIHDKDTKYTWSDAVTVKIAALNAGTFAGFSDWRVPSVNELQTLAVYGSVAPAVDGAFHSGCAPTCSGIPCSCTVSDYYWTSSTYLGHTPFGWAVHFYDGLVSATSKTTPYYVRAVRGGN